MLFYPGTNCQIHKVGKGRNRKEVKLDNRIRYCISCGERKKVGAIVATTYNKILHNYCEDCYIIYRDQFKGIERLNLKLVISRNIKKKDKGNMTEIIWVYDTKKAMERKKSFSKLCKEAFESLSDKEREDNENDEKEYLKSLSDKEREILSEMTKFMEDNREKWENQRQERIKSYDGGTVIVSKSFDVDDGFNEEKDVHTFTAVLKNGKIGIFKDDGFYPEDIYCHYLRNDHEFNLFFDSIRISSYPIDRQYIRGSKIGHAESTEVYFDIEETINDNPITISFSDGMWSSSNFDNEEKYQNWDLDKTESDRDDIIKEIKDYIEKENIIKFIDN